MPTPEPPSEVTCGTMCLWTFKKSGFTPWFKTSWDAGTKAQELVESFSKETEAAAAKWMKSVKCVGPCPAGVKCEKGSVMIGPPGANGDRNTWTPQHTKDYSYYCIYVEVTARALVACYCGDDRPTPKQGSSEL
jgi:hypothetical protein